MRREPYGVGSIIHVVKRGTRGLPFLKDGADRHRLLLMLAHFNDKPSRPFWFNDLLEEKKITTFERATSWPDQDPLTKILAFCIHDNHLHFLLEEIREGGISSFMQKVGNGLSGSLNEKYHEYGSPFQGAYKSKTIDTDTYLRYVITYIQVKNTFEQFPDGYRSATEQFDRAYEWALQFPYSSLHDHLGRSDLPRPGRGIVSSDLFASMWSPGEYKKYAEDMILGRAHLGTDDKNAFRGAFI
ncbi:transposase [Candidatus Kaiserbacteria bacterium]|nr:transposase [Candidatus Kaiserbacteria bacterium]